MSDADQPPEDNHAEDAGGSPPEHQPGGQSEAAASEPGASRPGGEGAASSEETTEAQRGASERGEQGGSGGPSGEGAQAGAGEDAAAADEPEPPAQAEIHGRPLVDSLGQAVVHTGREGYAELCRALKDDGYDLFVGLTGVDYLTHPGRPLPEGIAAERFEVVVELVSIAQRRRIRVRCQVPAHDPAVPTLFDVWPGSEAHERETYDMFGITFDGHPDPSRILMPEDWEGHPLRKDYASGRVPVQFKESPGGR